MATFRPNQSLILGMEACPRTCPALRSGSYQRYVSGLKLCGANSPKDTSKCADMLGYQCHHPLGVEFSELLYKTLIGDDRGGQSVLVSISRGAKSGNGTDEHGLSEQPSGLEQRKAVES